jgi:hypothetical protein
MPVEIDTSGPLGALNDMLGQLQHFGRVTIGQELSSWQVDDMHRHRPFTERNRGKKSASTLVRPHSRYEVNRSRMAQRRVARRARKKNALEPAPVLRWSTRPILRAELLASLQTRLDEARGKLKWRKGGAK